MPVEVQIMTIIMGALAFSSTVWALVYFKVKKKELETRGSSAELGPVVDALRDDLADLKEHTRAELAELQERVDFTERVLSEVRSRNVIGPGDST